MTVLRHQLLDAQGRPRAGVIGTVVPYGGNRYAADPDSRPRAISAVSDASGWLSWDLPQVVPGRRGSWYLIYGIETDPVAVATQGTDTTVLVSDKRLGTVDTTGNLVIPAAPTNLDTLSEVITQLTGRLSESTLTADFVAVADVDENITATDLPFVPTGSVTATDVQGAIEEVAQMGSNASAAAGAQVFLTANQALTAGASDTQIKFNSTSWAYGGVALTTSGQNGLIVPTKGLYLLTGAANLYAATAGFRSAIVYVNYTRVTEFGRNGDAAEQDGWTVQVPLVLNTNDFVSLNAFTSGNAATIAGNTGGTLTWMSLVLLGTIP
jgi:hypothetical protein